MNPAEVAAVLDVGIAAVRDAESIALAYFRTDMAIDNQLADIAYDPVPEADKRVEANVRDAINARFPEHQVIGEESGTTGSGPVSWIIDPIDETHAFISVMTTWGTLLGLVVDGHRVAGVMHQPFTDETFAADPLRGSRFLHAGTERRLGTRTLDDAIMYSTHPSMLEWRGRTATRRSALEGRVPMGGGIVIAAADPRPARTCPGLPSRLTRHPTGRSRQGRRWTSTRSTAPCTPTPSGTG
jgi:fructose-1,6-bisphosphatase/inositol monophosphatase family enzyme